MCIGVLPPPPPLFFFSCQAPLKTANCSSPPLFRQSPLYIGFSWTPSMNVLHKHKISQFKFLVMTEKYFCLETFFVIEYYFFVRLQPTTPHPPLWKKLPTLFQQSPSQGWGPVKPPLFENLVGGSNAPPPHPVAEKRRGGGGGERAHMFMQGKNNI